MLDRLNPDWSDKITYYWDPTPGGGWYEDHRIVHGTWVIDPEIKHPFMRQYTIGIERELFKDASFSVTYINRTYHNFQGPWNALATYEPVDTAYEVWDPDQQALVDKTFRFFDLTSGDAAQWHLTDVGVIADRLNDLYGLDLKAYRKYWGIEVLFNKRFSNKWQMLASYVYSRALGTIDNSSAYDDIGWDDYADPNVWVNADGHVANDPTHMIKIQGSYVLPFDISFNAYFHAHHGQRLDPAGGGRRAATSIRDGSRSTSKPAGPYHYPMATALDVRLEKIFDAGLQVPAGPVSSTSSTSSMTTPSRVGGTGSTTTGSRTILTYSPSTQGHDLYGLVMPRRAGSVSGSSSRRQQYRSIDGSNGGGGTSRRPLFFTGCSVCAPEIDGPSVIKSARYRKEAPIIIAGGGRPGRRRRGGLFPLSRAGRRTSPGCGGGRDLNVIVITLDTTRADRLGRLRLSGPR